MGHINSDINLAEWSVDPVDPVDLQVRAVGRRGGGGDANLRVLIKKRHEIKKAHDFIVGIMTISRQVLV
jgi:hypothetical protein